METLFSHLRVTGRNVWGRAVGSFQAKVAHLQISLLFCEKLVGKAALTSAVMSLQG